MAQTITVQDLLDKAGIEKIFPGQKIVKRFKKPGQFKSHCMVINWRDPAKLRFEIKAGLSGKDLPPSELKKYPVSLQAPTYFEFDIEKESGAETVKTKVTTN